MPLFHFSDLFLFLHTLSWWSIWLLILKSRCHLSHIFIMMTLLHFKPSFYWLYSFLYWRAFIIYTSVLLYFLLKILLNNLLCLFGTDCASLIGSLFAFLFFFFVIILLNSLVLCLWISFSSSRNCPGVWCDFPIRDHRRNESHILALED